MRVARFAPAGGDPQYGIIELPVDGGEYPNTIAGLTGDPLAGPVHLANTRFDLEEVRLLAPVLPRSKVVCAGNNYLAHAEEMGAEVQDRPTLFFKPNTSVIGPNDAIIKPKECKELHYEGELAVVIGRICRNVPVERVQEVIFGYTCANDVTARDIQRNESQWTRAKGFDTFCPIGPWMTTHLQLPEANDLRLTTTLDNKLVQEASTAEMICQIPELISYISEFTTLLPGDIVLTGTPKGVGQMVAGQTVSIEIEELGTLANQVVDE